MPRVARGGKLSPIFRNPAGPRWAREFKEQVGIRERERRGGSYEGGRRFGGPC